VFRRGRRVLILSAFVFLGMFPTQGISQVPIASTLMGIRYPVDSCRALFNSLRDQLTALRKPIAVPLELVRLRNFKVMSWNLDFFEIANTFDYQKPTDWANLRRERHYGGKRVRGEEELQQIKNIILEQDPDVMLLIEVGDLASVRKFASDPKYLNGKYDLLIHPSNQFGSSLGYLVRRGLPLNLIFETHLHAQGRLRTRTVKLFTRDVPALILFPENRANDAVIFLGVHAKSMGDSPPYDPFNIKRRAAEFNGINEIKAYYRRQYPNAKFVVMGDMNTNTLGATEYKIIKQNDVSFLDLAGMPVDHPQRYTHTHIKMDRETNRTLKVVTLQLDDILVDKKLRKHFVDGQIIPFQDRLGREIPKAKSIDERNQQLSDHKPISAVFDFYSLFFR